MPKRGTDSELSSELCIVFSTFERLQFLQKPLSYEPIRRPAINNRHAEVPSAVRLPGLHQDESRRKVPRSGDSVGIGRLTAPESPTIRARA